MFLANAPRHPPPPAAQPRSAFARYPRLVKCAAMVFLGAAGGLAGLACQSSSTKSSAPGPVAEIPAGGFTPKWRADLGLKSDHATNVYVREDLVIIYTRDHFAHVLDRESGVV